MVAGATLCLLWGSVWASLAFAATADAADAFAGLIGVTVILVGLALLWWASATLLSHRVCRPLWAVTGPVVASVGWAAATFYALISGATRWLASVPVFVALLVLTGFTVPIGVACVIAYVVLRLAPHHDGAPHAPAGR